MLTRYQQVAFLALASLASCDLFSVSREEVVRLPSPDQKTDAVVIETDGGATTGFGYEIHIVRHEGKPQRGDEAAFLYDAARSPSAYGVNLAWVSSGKLAVQYDAAKIAKLNYADVDIDGDRITVELQSGKPDPYAPAGGMAHNLLKGRTH